MISIINYLSEATAWKEQIGKERSSTDIRGLSPQTRTRLGGFVTDARKKVMSAAGEHEVGKPFMLNPFGGKTRPLSSFAKKSITTSSPRPGILNS